jgi:hypothetical protein
MEVSNSKGIEGEVEVGVQENEEDDDDVRLSDRVTRF